MWVLDVFVGMSGLAIALLVIGIILLIVEMFIPGFGVAGILGLLCTITGIVLASNTLMEAVVLVCIVLLILGVMLFIVVRSAKRGRLSKTLVLSDQLTEEAGYASSEDWSGYLGKEGITVTMCRPAGTAEFDGVKLDVVSDSTFIDAKKPVKVTTVEGNRIVVQQI